MDTIETLAERNSNMSCKNNRKSNANREHNVQKLKGTIETVAERNSNRGGMVRVKRKSNTNWEQGSKTYGYYSNSNNGQKRMDTIVTVAERNSYKWMVKENRKSNTNRERCPKTDVY